MRTKEELQEIILKKFRKLILGNQHSSKYSFSLASLKPEMDKFSSEEHEVFLKIINQLEQDNIILIENSENPKLTLLTLTNFGKNKI